MLKTSEIDELLKEPTDCLDLLHIRQATLPWVTTLSTDMAIILSPFTGTRRLVPFLASICDAIANKLEIDDEQLKLSTVKETKTVKQWLDDKWANIERDIWFAVSRDGRGYILTQWTDEGPSFSAIDAYDNQCGAYAVKDNGKTVYTWNMWNVKGDMYFDVYYPERIEKYIKYKDKKEWEQRQDTLNEEWPIDWTDNTGEPLGIALQEFDIGCSDVLSSLQIGRDLNEALLDLLAVSRTQGWPQRYLKGQRNSDVLTNGLGQPIVSGHTGRPIKKQLTLAPGSTLLLNDSSELGQLNASVIDVGLINKLMELLSFISTVPTHYFNGEWPSGVALIQSESRLNHLVEDHQGYLSETVSNIILLLLRLSNTFAGTKYKTDQKVIIPWKTPVILTDDLIMEHRQSVVSEVTLLTDKGLISKKQALIQLYPEWNELQIEEELLLISQQQNDVSINNNKEITTNKSIAINE